MYVKGVGPARAAMLEAKGLKAVEDVLTYAPFRYEDRSIRVDYTPSLRARLLALLDEMRTAKRDEEYHIDHNQPKKCQSCGFRSVCGESLI